MFRKALSVLLVFSWIVLSGLDVVEDLDLPDQIEFQNSTKAASRGNGPSGPLARNIVESATDGGIRCSSWLEQLTAPTINYAPYFSRKVSKLHKVHRVFLI
jgi:hypothetical protein